MISFSATVWRLPPIQTEVCIEYIIERWDTFSPFKSSYPVFLYVVPVLKIFFFFIQGTKHIALSCFRQVSMYMGGDKQGNLTQFLYNLYVVLTTQLKLHLWYRWPLRFWKGKETSHLSSMCWHARRQQFFLYFLDLVTSLQ